MYSLIKSTADICGKPIDFFGIRGNGVEYPYISECIDDVLAVIDLCNRLDVAPVHVEDVVEDLLYS